jgi:hypothetical protein
MLLSESYIKRLGELAGLKPSKSASILKEVEDLYSNSSKRVKFDTNIMKQAIEGGMEVGMVFQSNNTKYKMPVWKMRIVQPVAMGYDKKGQLVVRGIHVEGQSEKKAIETGIRSAQAKNEWRLFKASNVKSMFFTGRLFDKVGLPGYNPNDSSMTSVIASFNPDGAKEYQKQLNVSKNKAKALAKEPKIEKPVVKTPDKPVVPKTPQAPVNTKAKEDAKKLQQKIDKLNKLF